MKPLKVIVLIAVFTAVFFALAVGIRHTTRDVSYALPGILFIGALSLILYLLCTVGEGRPIRSKSRAFPLLAVFISSLVAAGMYLVFVSLL